MTEKTFRRLGIAAAVLAGLLGGSWLLGSGISDADASEVEAPFSWVSLESVDSATLRTGTGPIVLARAGDGWTVNGLRADPGLVGRFWDDVLESRMVERASVNPDNHERMGVAGDGSLTLTLHTPVVSRELIVGEPGQRITTNFVRRPGEEDVWLLDRDIRAHLTRSLDVWRDRRVLALDTAAVHQVQLERAGETLHLTRSEDGWLFGDAEANATTMRNLLSELAALRATGFVAMGDDLAQEPERVRVTVLAEDGEEVAVLTMSGGDGDRWLRSRDDVTLYRISDWRAGRIAPSTDDLEAGDEG